MPARDPLEVLQESLNRSHLEFSFLAQLAAVAVKRVRLSNTLEYAFLPEVPSNVIPYLVSTQVSNVT